MADRQPAMAVPTGLLKVSDDEAPVHVNTATIESQPHLPPIGHEGVPFF